MDVRGGGKVEVDALCTSMGVVGFRERDGSQQEAVDTPYYAVRGCAGEGGCLMSRKLLTSSPYRRRSPGPASSRLQASPS